MAIAIPTKETAPTQSKPILERYEKNLGVTPNFFSLIARSPDVLSAESNMHAVLGKSLITDADFAAVRAAGFSDEQIIDIVAETAFRFTTNLFNNTFQTDIDPTFPPLQTRYEATIEAQESPVPDSCLSGSAMPYRSTGKNLIKGNSLCPPPIRAFR